MFKTSLAPLALLAFLAGCSSSLEQKAITAQTSMIGFTDAQLKACLGEPVAVNREGGTDIWSYFRETSRSATSVSDVGYTPANRGETSYDYFRYCEAVFLLHGGKVQALEFRGRTSTGRRTLEPCGALVQRCVPGK